MIRDLFDEFLLFVKPDLHAQVDFSSTPDFLQQELFQMITDTKKGRGVADQIVKVKLKDGAEQWILIHVEVQSSNEREFASRMFQYFYRIYDQYDEKIAALAIMTSPHESKADSDFRYDFFGTTLHYAYTICKLLDYAAEELRNSNKLFSKVILAAKQLHITKDKETQRYQFKMNLMRELVRNERYSRTAVQAVFHFIDYLLKLPKDLERKLADEMYPILGKETKLMELYNKENASPTISNAFEMERLEGKQQGRMEAQSEERRRFVKIMLKEGWSVEKIAELSEVSLDEVRLIRDHLLQ